MLKVASHVCKSPSFFPDLDVFNSNNVHISFPAILDSGATSGFAPTSWLKHMLCVVNLKTPVKVKLGTSTSYARSKGLIPICIASASDKQGCLICLMEFYCVDNFFPDLLLIPLNAFEQIQWCSTTGVQHAFLYRESKSLRENSDAALKLINHDVKGLSKYTSVIEVTRTGNGLKSLQLRSCKAFQSHRCLETNKPITTRCLRDHDSLLKHCSIIKAKTGQPKRVHFSFSTAHTDFNKSDEAECANLLSCVPNSGGTSRHWSSWYVAATTPASSLVAKAPIPPEPPPFKLKVLLIGAGVCTEQYLSLKLPLEVVCVIEIGDVIEHARKSFPNAQVLENLDSVIERLEHNKLKLVPFDLVMSTLPCTDESRLKSLNKYGDTKTIHLFRESQAEFVRNTLPNFVLIEMVAPLVDHFEAHEAVLQEHRNLGYSVAIDLVDAAHAGDYTSHHRWFMLASRYQINSFNVLKDSGLSCHPKPIASVLSSETLIPANLYISQETSPVTTNFAPKAVIQLFRSFLCPKFFMPGILLHENAFACVLLAWHIAKTAQGSNTCLIGLFDQAPRVPHISRISHISHVKSIGTKYLRNPTEMYIFSLLARFDAANPTPHHLFEITLSHAPSDITPSTIYFGVKSPDSQVFFICKPISTCAGVTNCDIVAHMNSIFTNCARLVTGGVEFNDTRNVLRSVTLATQAHTFAYIGLPGQKRQKGTTIAAVTGVVPTMTSDFNVILEVPSRTSSKQGSTRLRYMTLREGSKAKSFDNKTLKYLQSLPVDRAFKKIAQAIPKCLLEAVYLTVYKHAVEVRGCSTARTWLDACVFRNQQVHRAHSSVGLNPTNVDIHLSKRKKPKGISSVGWRPGPHPSTAEFARTQFEVDLYHRSTHRSASQIEADIYAGCIGSRKLLPGDSRFMSPCEVCDLNRPKLPVRHHNPDWHSNELNYEPGEAFQLDVLYSTVLSRFGKFKYHLVCVCIISGFVFERPLPSLDTDDFIIAMNSIKTQLKLEFNITLKMLIPDSASTFKEEHRLTRWKIENNCQMSTFAPHLHEYNKAENYIKLLRNGAVIRLHALKGVLVGGTQVIPEAFFPEAFRHTAETLNQGASAFYARTHGKWMSPRQILGSGETPVLHPFGAHVTIGLSKGMNNPDREANALGNSKSQLKSIAGLFLCSANYHPALMAGLRSMSSAILLVTSSGKRIVSKNYFCTELSRQARGLAEFKTQCKNRNDKVSLVEHEPPGTFQPPEQMPAAAIPAPTTEQLSRYPIQAAPVEARDVGAQLQLQAPSTPVSAPKRLAPIADSHPESVFGEKDPARFFEAIMPPSPAVPAPEDSKPAESDMSPIQGMPWFSPAPSIHSPAPPSSLPPSPPQAQPTQVPVGVSKSEQLPFKVPAGGDYIQLKNWDGEWETWLVQAPNVSATEQMFDPLTGCKLKKKEKAAIIAGDEKKSLDVRKRRYGHPGGKNEKAVWHFVSRNSEEAAAFNRRFNIVPKVSKADMRKQTLAMVAIPATPRTVPLVSALYDQDHRALFTGSSDKSFTSKNCLPTAAINPPAISGPQVELSFNKVAGTDYFSLFSVSRTSNIIDAADTYHSAIPLALATTHQIVADKELQSPIGEFRRLKSFPTKFRTALSPTTVIEAAHSADIYIMNGGSFESLRYEIAMGTIVPKPSAQHRYDSPKKYIEAFVQGGVDLASSYFTREEISTAQAVNKAKHIAEKAFSANLLWGSPSPTLYELVRSHHRALFASDPNEHLFCSHFDQKREDDLEKALSFCEDKFSEVTVCLQVTVEDESRSTSHTLSPNDIHYEPEVMMELKEESLEHKRNYLTAIMKEVGDLCKNTVFSLEVVPEIRSPISTKLVLKIKRRGDGSFEKYKARLVVRGFLAKVGVDFYSTFAPMASLNTVRTLLSIAVKMALPIYHADIPQAFIQTELDRDIYIKFPRGISIKEDILRDMQEKYPNSKLGIRLLRSLYGLKQAPMLWNSHLNEVLVSAGYERSKSDTSLYVQKRTVAGKDVFAACAVFVDDIVVTGDDTEKLDELKDLFIEKFKGDTHQWEPINSFLGMDITYTNGKLTMNVKAKIEDLFNKYPFLKAMNNGKGGHEHAPHCASMENPPERDDTNLSKLQESLKENFASIVGSCIYFSVTCRPDISTIVSFACRGMHDPKKIHLIYLEHLLRYLLMNSDVGLTYEENSCASGLINELSRFYPELKTLPESPIVGFSDANWLSKVELGDQMRSISGHCIFCFGNLVQWSSKRQTLTAGSTMEAELIAASSAADAAVWYFTLQEYFPVLFGLTSKPLPVPLLIDNKACLSVANHPMSSPRTRHICIREFRIRDYAEERKIRPYWTPGTHNVADHFTKPLAKTLFRRMLGPLGMADNKQLEPFPQLFTPTNKPARANGYAAEFCLHAGEDAPTWHVYAPMSNLKTKAAWIYYNLRPGEFPPGYVN